MHRTLRRSILPSLRTIECASRRPMLCFVVRDDENKTGGMIVREKNLPAEVGKPQTPPRSASEVIAEMAAKVARYPAKPKEESEGMSAEEIFQRGCEYARKKEYAEAVKWIHCAAIQGHAQAESSLGDGYKRGNVVPQDDVESVKWYRRAAEQGYARAQERIGYAYSVGEGVQQDHAEAVKWWRRAAEQGNATAQCNLGMMYYNGTGVSQNDAEAIKWCRRAAEQGDNAAILSLDFALRNPRSSR